MVENPMPAEVLRTEISMRLMLARTLAQDAGNYAVREQEHRLVVQQKKEGTGDIVTRVDKKNERTIKCIVNNFFPTDSFSGEEEIRTGKKSGDFKWVVDPIDGTLPYSLGGWEWGVSIGIHHLGRPVAGAISFPRMNNFLFFAQDGQGAFLNGERIHTRSQTNLEDGVFYFNTLYLQKSPDENAKMVKKYLVPIYRGLGHLVKYIYIPECVTLTICRMASGDNVSVFFNPMLSPYDLGAAAIVLEEAGGVHSRIDWTKKRQPFLAAANRSLYEQTLETLGPKLIKSFGLTP